VKLAFGVAMNPLVTQPIPLSHVAWTRFVFPGSNCEGITFVKFPGGSVVGSMSGGGSKLMSAWFSWIAF
jgi:hypothetical protein